MSDPAIKIHHGDRTTAKDWAYVPDPDKPSTWALRFDDAVHVRDAMARFNQTELPEEAKHKVAARIVARAKALGVDPSGFELRYLSAVVMFSASASAIPRTNEGQLTIRGDGLVRVPVFQLGEFVKGSQDVGMTPQLLAQVRANMPAHGVPVSYEHTIEHPERALGGPIPSAGKLRELEGSADKDGNVYGWMQPTRRALDMMREGEYEHTSPAYAIHLPNIKTGKDQGATLLSLALTNRPFLPTPPITRSLITMGLVLPAADETQHNTPAAAGKEKRMKKVKVSAITDGDKKGNLEVKHDDLTGDSGYYADAGEVADALGKASKTEHSAQVAQVITLSGVAATELTPEVVTALAGKIGRGVSAPQVIEMSAVPQKDGRPDFAALEVPAGGAVSGDVVRAWQSKIELDAAVAGGKVLPAQRVEFERIAAKDIGLFRSMLNLIPAQVQLGSAGTGLSGAGQKIELSAEETAIARQMGLDPAKVQDEKKRLAQAGAA